MKKIMASLNYLVPIGFLVFGLLGFLLAPNDPYRTNIQVRFLSSTIEFPFGTDELGRCVFSRIVEGGKLTLGIVFLGSCITIALGTFLGILIAQTKKGNNILSESLLNAVTALPPVAYLIILIGVWGNSVPTMLVALTVSSILRTIKLVKSLVEAEFSKAYILCAVASGAGKSRILAVHILPNIIRRVVGFICLSSAEMILAISGFSFIGITLGDEMIDWGVLLSDARTVAATRPELIFWPILFIFLSALSFHYLGRLLEREASHG